MPIETRLVSAMLPLPLIEVATGILSVSAKRGQLVPCRPSDHAAAGDDHRARAARSISAPPARPAPGRGECAAPARARAPESRRPSGRRSRLRANRSASERCTAPGRPAVAMRIARRVISATVARRIDARVPLRDRPEERFLVELGQHAALLLRDRRVGGHAEQRNRRALRLGDAGHDVGRAAAARAFADADAPRSARVGIGHERGRTLVTRHDVLDAVARVR